MTSLPLTLAGRVALASFVAVAVGCALSLVTTLVAVRLHDSGFDSRAIGFNAAAGGIATLATAPLIPWAARRLGVARLMAGSLFFGGAAIAAFTLTGDYIAWAALRFVEGACVTTIFVLAEYWIASSARASKRGLVIGLYVASLTVGFACGPQVLALTGNAGPLPFLIGGVAFAGTALPILYQARSAPPLEAPRGSRGLLHVLGTMPTGMLAALLHGALEVSGLTFLPVYALRSGRSLAQGALFASLFVLGSVIFQLPMGLVADRVDRGRLLVLIAVIGLSGALLLGSAGSSNLVLFEFLLAVWGGVVGSFYPIGLGDLGKRYQGTELASANSAFVMMYAAGMLIGPPVVGLGLDLVPPDGLFWASAGLIGLYLAVAGAHELRAGLRSPGLKPRNS